MSEPRAGDAVFTGRDELGILRGYARDGRALLQVGPAGPFLKRSCRGLRRATLAEIEDSYLKGVGCNQATEAAQTPEQRELWAKVRAAFPPR